MAAKFVSLNITPDAREAVRRMAAIVTAETESRVTHSDALLIAEKVLRAHRAEIADVVKAMNTPEEEQS